MYKKILSLNTTTSNGTGGGGGLNKAENVTSTITLKDLKQAAVIAAAASDSRSNHSSSDVDVNDENAPSNFESVTSNGDKVIYESPYERPLTGIHTSPTQTSHIQHHHHLSHVATPPKIEGEIETDYAPQQQQQTYPTAHKSIHHTTPPLTTTSASTTQHYRDMMVDENLENKQQNFVNDEEDVWRPW
jgi:hypothetical protein